MDFAALAGSILILPLLAATLATRLGPPLYNYTRTKYLIFACPPLLLLYAQGAAGLLVAGRRRLAGLLVGAVLAANAVSLGNYFFNPEYLRAPAWRDAASILRDERRRGEPVVCDSIWAFAPMWANLRPDPGDVYPIGRPAAVGPSRFVDSPAAAGVRPGGTFWILRYCEWRSRVRPTLPALPPAWDDSACPLLERHAFRGVTVERRRVPE